LTGVVLPCLSPCGTCQKFATYCLSCIAEYSINGATCFSDKAVLVVVVFTPRSYYDDSDSDATKLRKVYNNLYNLKKSLCTAIPEALKIGED
jgi:hypothetical protein